MHINTLVR
jgi:hypothetical protein